MPRPSGSDGQELEVRLNYGRLQTLVTATATSAKEVLLACDQPHAQARHGVVEVSLDDIDDGASEPSCVSRAPRVPRMRLSRGGIMLDVAAGPPELVPLILAGRGRLALHPTASA